MINPKSSNSYTVALRSLEATCGKFTAEQIQSLAREPMKTSQGHILRCDIPFEAMDIEPYIAYPIELKSGGFSETSVNAFWWLIQQAHDDALQDFETRF